MTDLRRKITGKKYKTFKEVKGLSIPLRAVSGLGKAFNSKLFNRHTF